MSKLIDAIQVHRTNRRFAKPSGAPQYTDILTIDEHSFNPVPHMTEYRIDVRLGANVRWDTGRTVEPLTRQVIRMIEQHVFGEFREDFDAIQRALWELDLDKASELLEAMRAKMFSS
jgi:hypothetical protein